MKKLVCIITALLLIPQILLANT
ncbi:MAG: hypothetical protein ACD_39C00582G0001, partial [uncultured bacterium]